MVKKKVKVEIEDSKLNKIQFLIVGIFIFFIFLGGLLVGIPSKHIESPLLCETYANSSEVIIDQGIYKFQDYEVSYEELIDSCLMKVR